MQKKATMRTPFTGALVFIMLALCNPAAQVPGTSVSLTPPEGFASADRFPGFMKESTGSSIMISEIPGPYAEVAAGFSDEKRMKAQGMRLLSKSSVTIDGQTAVLLHVEQPAYGTLFKKWLLAVDRSGSTVLIAATYPKAEENEQASPLKAAILAATFGDPSDPMDALTFTATPVAPFEVATVMGQNMILSPGGDFPVEDESVPFMVLGLSASEDLLVQERKAFAERRVRQTATVTKITVRQTTPVMIGGLSGFTTTASGVGEDGGTPLIIHQTLLFDSSGYCLIQGVTPSGKQGTYVPIFEKIANTFEVKK